MLPFLIISDTNNRSIELLVFKVLFFSKKRKKISYAPYNLHIAIPNG